MKKRFLNFFKGEVLSFLFYIALGLCLILMPVQMVNVICKVIFGLVLIGVGSYNIYKFVGEKDTPNILDLFSGVIVFVLGAFLFFNPQVVVKLLPFLLGAFILVDSIWTLRGCFRLYKRSREEWRALLIGGILFVTLGAVMIANPFAKTTHTVIFAGWVFLANGLGDFALMFVLKHGMKKADEAVQIVDAQVETEQSQLVDTISGEPVESTGEYMDEPDMEEPAADELTQTEKTEEPEAEEHIPEEDEILEEWKD